MNDKVTINKVFDTENFSVLTSEESEYIWLDVKGKTCTLVIKKDDEGVVVDVYGADPEEPIAGTWATWDELEVV